ncbi:MAG TPA: hypothetical protein VMW41_04410 [Candidatus Bathyarchaeia archaeon]|nr:hypothetical protein [Candidatus Bathyarchaeia archaeon]
MNNINKKKFSQKIQCGHCLNNAPMEIVAQFSRIVDRVESNPGDYDDVCEIYQVLQCPACFEVLFQKYQWCDAYMETPGDTTIELLPSF